MQHLLSAINTKLDHVTHRTPTIPFQALFINIASDLIVYNRFGLEGGGRRLRRMVEFEQEQEEREDEKKKKKRRYKIDEDDGESVNEEKNKKENNGNNRNNNNVNIQWDFPRQAR